MWDFPNHPPLSALLSRAIVTNRPVGAICHGPAGPDLLQRVLQRQVTVRDAARVLTTAEARSLAYEMAVCVCDADGRLNAEERSFLREAQRALDVGAAPAATTQREVEALIVDGLEDLPGPAGAAAPTADTSTGMSAPAPRSTA
jgi:putative intracellular protease/amidase